MLNINQHWRCQMSKSSEDSGVERADEPDDEVLEEPSTEKSQAEEPKAADSGQPEPSHEAVGIGVVGRPLVEPEEPANAS
jgi:hypothetical protein